jgi:flagellar motor switch protein FliN
MFSIPQDRVNLVELQHSQAFSDECFINSYAYVKIRAGYTKLTLEELKSLSKDDIIVLEDSTINKLTLISGNIEKDFRVEIDKSLILKMDSNDENNEETEYGVEMEKNLWDNIQIELSAEFSKVKMTIGELKQITKGQIVDLGSVFDNEISLYIENKKVAKGELLIINDKYAVRLNEVLNSDVAASAPSEAQSNKPAEKPQKQAKAEAPQQQKVEDEEFDYSDFEN